MDLFTGGLLVMAGLVVLVILAGWWTVSSERRRDRKSDRKLEAQERSWIEAWHARGELPPFSVTGYYRADWVAEQDKGRMLALHYTIDADEWVPDPRHREVRRIAYRLPQRTIAALSQGKRLGPY
jgi:hypothetical protein